MFKWFRSEKKEIEEPANIPEPPPANLGVALMIRNNRYNYLYYYHSEDLNEEIAHGFQKREDWKEEKKERMRLLHNEIVNEFVFRQHRRIERIHRSIFFRKEVPKAHTKRSVLKQYKVRHIHLMEKLRSEVHNAYKKLLVLRLDKINHQMLMLILQYEISSFCLPIHNLNISFPELQAHVKNFQSFQKDKKLHQTYMRYIRKEIVKVNVTYKNYLKSKEEHRILMTEVLKEIRNVNISYSYSSSEEEYFINNKCINKHLKIADEDQNFIQWGIIDPFVKYDDDEKYTFFRTEKQDPIFIELDMAEFEYLKEIAPKSDSKMQKSKLEKMAKREGYMEIFLGPMFGSKSSRILFKLSCMADQRFRCLYVNNSKDVRNTEAQDAFVTTHNSSYSKISPKISCVKVSNLADVNIEDFDYIGVDEFQFFDNENTVQTIIDWVTQYGKYVIIASLDGDCYRRKFGKVLDLIPHANEVTKLCAYCDMCRDNYGKMKPAPFTARMTSDTTAELVGGTDLYKAMCRECHDFHLDVTVRKY